jgi:hypothetical protein
MARARSAHRLARVLNPKRKKAQWPEIRKALHCSMEIAPSLTCQPAHGFADKSDKLPKKRERTTTAEFASPARSVEGGIDK